MSWYIISTAIWLGILTAISPCPLVANISAISFIGRFVGHKHYVLLSGLLYTAGRTVTYLIIGILISSGILASSELSLFLQKHLNEILGPTLILLGMILFGMLGTTFSLNVMSHEKLKKHAIERGFIFAFPIGVIFALSLCPVSAGLFFGALIPLTLKIGSSFIIPAVYGVGTAIPVIFFAFIIAFGSEYIGKMFHCLTKIEIWFRNTTGILFTVAGIYYCLIYIYEVL